MYEITIWITDDKSIQFKKKISINSSNDNLKRMCIKMAANWQAMQWLKQWEEKNNMQNLQRNTYFLTTQKSQNKIKKLASVCNTIAYCVCITHIYIDNLLPIYRNRKLYHKEILEVVSYCIWLKNNITYTFYTHLSKIIITFRWRAKNQ